MTQDKEAPPDFPARPLARLSCSFAAAPDDDPGSYDLLTWAVEFKAGEVHRVAARRMTVCLTTTVLLIEDDHDVLETLANVLELEGYVPLLAVNGREGMTLFKTQAPKLVVTDLLMPEKEGIETIIEMRRLRPDAKIIAISGGGLLGKMNFLDMAAMLGATAILRKPFEPNELVAAVTRLLSVERDG